MAYDAYMNLDGHPGSATDEKHKNWIEVLSFHWGVEQQGASRSTGGDQTTGKANLRDLSIVKVVDQCSPKLALTCATGAHVKSAVLEWCQATGQKHCFMKYTLTDVVISSVQLGGQSGGNDSKPTEEVSMRYAKIQWEYTPVDEKGKAQAATKGEWDLKLNKGA
ncbi:MAG: type VI secretion system tube protein Hcp [Phycisphaerales bacterium]|jgi:type VI secretion system secreted protein Hcp|nr:type VI secretion system tube protein Hcp [Phycisphaerales bacterium]